MSNKNGIEWAYNELTISVIKDDKKTIDELAELSIDLEDESDNSALTFYNHCPIPTILLDNYDNYDNISIDENIKHSGYENIYQFTLHKWGCLYDAKNVVSSQIDNLNLYYEFQTRSKPPISWIKEISSLYPNLMFELHTNNEFELWEEHEVVYIDGHEVIFEYLKKQKNEKPKQA